MRKRRYTDKQLIEKERQKRQLRALILLFFILIQVAISNGLQSGIYKFNIENSKLQEKIDVDNITINSVDSEIIKILRLDEDNIKFMEKKGYVYQTTTEHQIASNN